MQSGNIEKTIKMIEEHTPELIMSLSMIVLQITLGNLSQQQLNVIDLPINLNLWCCSDWLSRQQKWLSIGRSSGWRWSA